MERIPCEACLGVTPQDKASGKYRCHECHNVGYLEVNTSRCTHLPPTKIEHEIMCNGWTCECGASGPWTTRYDKAYNAALNALT